MTNRPSKDVDLSMDMFQSAAMALHESDGVLMNNPHTIIVNPEAWAMIERAYSKRNHRIGVKARAKRRGRRQ